MEDEVTSLEAWFLKVQRALPWRKTKDPYRIWVSEIMLQQTQVATVIPYYHRFLEAFPSIKILAEASETEVLRRWSGLGYYSRARNLQKGAKYLLENFKGRFPTSREEILKVPGIGPYTAGAILSIAFNLKEPLVDGNVIRVFSRYFGFKEVVDLPKNQRFFWEKASELVMLSKNPKIFNQALMELGATVCTKSSPLCLSCPLQKTCVAYKKELTSLLPLRKARTAIKNLEWTLTVYERNEEILLRKNPKGSWWEGLWDLPRGKKVSKRGVPLPQVLHTVTHHKITVSPVHVLGKAPKPEGEELWIKKKEILDWPLSSLSRKVLTSLDF